MINAKLLQLVIEASNDGIVVAEQEGDDNILIYANPAFEAVTCVKTERWPSSGSGFAVSRRAGFVP